MINLTKISKQYLKTSIPNFEIGKNCWIAGGAVRDSILGEDYSDIDIFGTDKEALDLFVSKNLTNYKKIHDSQFLKSYKDRDNKVQIIYRFYKNIEECLDSFDYTICQFAYNYLNIYCNFESIIHLFEKRLAVHKINPEFSINSLERMQKYIKKGFTICSGGIKDVTDGIRSSTQDQIKNQIDFYPDGSPRIKKFD